MTGGRELSFDDVADEYERTRPSYPPELLDALPLPDDASVLDLAAGTGKLTRVLAERYRDVVAVEPLANMRAMLERVVPGVPALAGSAERIPLDDGSVDGVFTAQAFHWFAKDVALPEIARVLRADGVFAIVWNGPDEGRPSPLPAEFESALQALHDEVPHPWIDEPRWEDLLERHFADVHGRVSIPHDHVLDRAGLLDNARSTSWIASRDDREDVIARLGTLLPEGTYAIPNRAYVLWARRRRAGR
ncbi:MAG TPA: class I SAM-dependent methyltransferase [Gaiellaceae bacterium]